MEVQELFKALEQRGPWVPAWVKAYRKPAWARFQALGLPTRTNEDWKYTSVKALAGMQFKALTPTLTQLDNEDLTACLTPHAMADEIRLVFVDGVLSTAHSQVGSSVDGLTILPLTAALESHAAEIEKFVTMADAVTEGTASDQAFTALNQAFFLNGTYIEVARGLQISKRLHIVHISSGKLESSGHSAAYFPRQMLLVREGAQLTVTETYLGYGEHTYLLNRITDIMVEANARLEHVCIQQEAQAGYHIGTTRAQLGRDSTLRTFSFSAGGRLIRNDLQVVLNGTGADVQLNGLYLVRDAQHVDNHTVVDHRVPHATSSQVYKGIIDDQARAVFNGKVLVRRIAQKTAAHQLNRNLLLSPDAEIDTKPELMIDADDVKCAHGATIGQLAPDEIFYLQSRGVPRAEATRMLSLAFADEVLFMLPEQSTRERLRRLSADFFQNGSL